MKVLIVTRDFPPYLVGGMGIFVSNVSNLLAQKGIEVTVIAPLGDRGSKYEKLSNNLEIYRVPIIGKYFLTKVPSLMLSSYKLIKNLNYDIIHLFTPVIHKAIKKDAKIIYHFQSSRYGEFKALKMERKYLYAFLNWLYIPQEKGLAKKSDKIIAVSENTKKEVLSFIPNHQLDIFILPNGADINLFHPKRKLPNVEPYILFVGRLDERKGVEDLLRAYQMLPKSSEIKLPKLHIVGDGPLYERLRKNYEDINIRFLGRKDNKKDLPQIFANALLTVVPSTYEPCSLVIKESLASSTPVITSDCSPDLNMSQFKTGDYKSLTKTLLFLLKNPSKLKELRKRSRRIAEKYSWNNITNKLIDIYRKLK